jgi:hypothetical protein
MRVRGTLVYTRAFNSTYNDDRPTMVGIRGDVMKLIIAEIVALVAAVAFLIFLALDDRKNRRLREEEDRQKELQEQRAEVVQDEE